MISDVCSISGSALTLLIAPHWRVVMDITTSCYVPAVLVVAILRLLYDSDDPKKDAQVVCLANTVMAVAVIGFHAVLLVILLRKTSYKYIRDECKRVFAVHVFAILCSVLVLCAEYGLFDIWLEGGVLGLIASVTDFCVVLAKLVDWFVTQCGRIDRSLLAHTQLNTHTGGSPESYADSDENTSLLRRNQIM